MLHGTTLLALIPHVFEHTTLCPTNPLHSREEAAKFRMGNGGSMKSET